MVERDHSLHRKPCILSPLAEERPALVPSGHAMHHGIASPPRPPASSRSCWLTRPTVHLRIVVQHTSCRHGRGQSHVSDHPRLPANPNRASSTHPPNGRISTAPVATPGLSWEGDPGRGGIRPRGSPRTSRGFVGEERGAFVDALATLDADGRRPGSLGLRSS